MKKVRFIALLAIMLLVTVSAQATDFPEEPALQGNDTAITVPEVTPDTSTVMSEQQTDTAETKTTTQEQQTAALDGNTGAPGHEAASEVSEASEEGSARQAVANAASAVADTTDTASMVCGAVGPAGGLAAVPCIAAQGVNLIANGISWLFSR